MTASSASSRSQQAREVSHESQPDAGGGDAYESVSDHTEPPTPTTREELLSLPVRELKARLGRIGRSFEGVFEKAGLVDLLLQ